MIIKNNIQLKNAEARRNDIQSEIEKYTGAIGIEYELYVRPLIIEIEELDREINVFKKLNSLPFEQAIADVLNKPIIIDNISELLSKLRIAAKKTQAEMAQELGWKQSNLSRFENENYSSQTISKIVEFASSLGIYLHVVPSLSEEPTKPLPKKLNWLVTPDNAETSTYSDPSQEKKIDIDMLRLPVDQDIVDLPTSV